MTLSGVTKAVAGEACLVCSTLDSC